MRHLKKMIWPEMVTINEINGDIESWLVVNVGLFKKDWYAVYFHDKTDYYFKQGSDAAFFVLRWT